MTCSALETADRAIDAAFDDGPIGTTEAACPLRSPTPDPLATHWIEFELVDADEQKPVAAEPYRLTLPNGRVLEGKLDARGVVRAEDIPEGECSIYFPELDYAMNAHSESTEETAPEEPAIVEEPSAEEGP